MGMDQYGLKTVRSKDTTIFRLTEAFVSWRGTTLEDGRENHHKYIRYEADVAEDCQFLDIEEDHSSQVLRPPPHSRQGRYRIVYIDRFDDEYHYTMQKEISFKLKGPCSKPIYYKRQLDWILCSKKNERIIMESGWIPM